MADILIWFGYGCTILTYIYTNLLGTSVREDTHKYECFSGRTTKRSGGWMNPLNHYLFIKGINGQKKRNNLSH